MLIYILGISAASWLLFTGGLWLIMVYMTCLGD